MPRRFALELNDIKRSDLAGMSREQLEELAWRLHELARLLANRAGWAYACSLIAAARANLTLPIIPANAAA